MRPAAQDDFDNDSEDRPAPIQGYDLAEHIRDSGNVWGTMRVISIHWKDTHWEYTLQDEEGDEKFDESELRLSARPPSPAYSPMRVDDESKEDDESKDDESKEDDEIEDL